MNAEENSKVNNNNNYVSAEQSSNNVNVNIHLFAKCKELFNASNQSSNSGGVLHNKSLPRNYNSSTDLLNRIITDYIPQIAPIKDSISIAINHRYCGADQDEDNKHIVLNHNDEIALIPPISGG